MNLVNYQPMCSVNNTYADVCGHVLTTIFALMNMLMFRYVLNKTDEWAFNGYFDWDILDNWTTYTPDSSCIQTNVPITNVGTSYETKYDVQFNSMSNEYLFTSLDLEYITCAAREKEQQHISSIQQKIDEHKKSVCVYEEHVSTINMILDHDYAVEEHYNKTMNDLYADTFDIHSSCIGNIMDNKAYCNLDTLADKRVFYENSVIKYKDAIETVHKQMSEQECILSSVNDTKRHMFEEQEKVKFATAKSSQLKHAHIVEYTPNGCVIMTYDGEHNSFRYYSDSNIPLKYIVSVGKKYTHVFKCKYVWELSNKYWVTNDEHTKTSTDDACTRESDKVFVRGNKNIHARKGPSVYDMLPKFVRMGKIGNFNVLKHPPKICKKVSFAEWLLISTTNGEQQVHC